MPPLKDTHRGNLCQIDDDEYEEAPVAPEEALKPYKMEIVWRNVVLFVLLHLGAIYGLYLFIFRAMWPTFFFTVLLWQISGLGITAGAHRLWSHKSYKAKLPLKIILMLFNCVSFQNDIIEWSRDHRVHHKYSETDADPHNANRGFFFAHIGWLLVRKHPDVRIKGARLDVSDLTVEPVLRFQRKHYLKLVVLFSFVLPSVIPAILWGEKLYTAFYTAAIFRYCFVLHITWCINSLAHMYGFRPYDKNISPRQNITTSITALGEGWHNYHHVFPYDYRASEYFYTVNQTTMFIDFFAWIGWAYDRKVVSQQAINRKKLKTGE